MPQTEYTYSIQNDFPNQAVNVEALDAEIRADATINVALEGTAVHLDDVVITFVDALPPGEKTALDNVVANHTGLSLVETPQRVQQIAEATTTSTNWQDALQLTPNAVRGGDWQITWYCEISVQSQANNSGIFARVLIDGVERAFSSSRDDQYQSFSGAGLIGLNDGDTPTIQLQYERAGASNTAKIRRCQLAMIPED